MANSGTSIDTSVWWVGTNSPAAVTIWEAEGRVTVGVSGHAPQDFSGGIGTLCRARGDFDARVGFELKAWPAFDGIWVALMAFDGSSLIGNVYRASASWGESYGAYCAPCGSRNRGTWNRKRRGAAACPSGRDDDWILLHGESAGGVSSLVQFPLATPAST